MDFLEQFSKKPIPKKQPQILLPVNIETKIIEKTDTDFDANAFRQRLQQFQKVQSTMDVPSVVEVEVEKVKPIPPTLPKDKSLKKPTKSPKPKS